MLMDAHNRKNDIQKLAGLARIRISKEELSGLEKDFEGILVYISQIQKATGGVFEEDIGNGLRNVFREDENPHESGIHTEALLAQTPKREKNYLKVKKILEK